jgi:hypothetical protein
VNTTTFLFTFLVAITITQFAKMISLNLFAKLYGMGLWWGTMTPNHHKSLKFLGTFDSARGI